MTPTSRHQAHAARSASRHADVIVVGLGAMGSATCFQLAARGVSVIGIDLHQPPHPFGSTHGDTRITRLAIGEGAEYVPLVRRSHELWPGIEDQTGATLMTHAGGLMLGRASSEFLAQTRASARDYGITHENLTNAQIAERFPMFELGLDIEGYYEPEAGYVRPEAAISAQLGLARRHGARLRLRERVKRWSADSNGVTVETASGVYVADQLVLSAGPWITELFPESREIFAVYRQLMYWFPITQGYERLRDMPIFVIDFGTAREDFVHLDGFYGLPAIDGPLGGLKVATESYERTTAPDGRQHPATRDEVAAMYERCIAPHLPWLGSEPLRTASCLYTNTRGGGFVIDRHPSHERAMIVSACSGHGFKHSPAIGEAVAELLADGSTAIDLSPFSLSAARRPKGQTPNEAVSK